MDAGELVERYPRLFHMAAAGSWDSISRFGLLPTSRIVETSGLDLQSQSSLLLERRPMSVHISHPELGDVTIRDQGPLNLHNLHLTDISLEEWLATLNDRVFFWLHPARLDDLLAARRYRAQEQDVITIDTASLLASDAFDRVRLSPLNSGATIYPSAPSRGRGTFLPIEQYDFEYWLDRRRSERNAIVELAVVGGVEDLLPHVIAVERRLGAATIQDLYTRR